MVTPTAEQIAEDRYVASHQRELARNSLGTEAAAIYIERSVHTLRYHVRQGNIAVDHLIGQNWVFTKEELDRHVRDRRLPGRPRGSRVIGQIDG